MRLMVRSIMPGRRDRSTSGRSLMFEIMRMIISIMATIAEKRSETVYVLISLRVLIRRYIVSIIFIIKSYLVISLFSFQAVFTYLV